MSNPARDTSPASLRITPNDSSSHRRGSARALLAGTPLLAVFAVALLIGCDDGGGGGGSPDLEPRADVGPDASGGADAGPIDLGSPDAAMEPRLCATDPVYVGDVVLQTQLDVERIEGCTEIDGDLIVGEAVEELVLPDLEVIRGGIFGFGDEFFFGLDLRRLSAPRLREAQSVWFREAYDLAVIELPSLERARDLTCSECYDLRTLDAPALEEVSSIISIGDSDQLRSLDFPSLVTLGDIYIGPDLPLVTAVRLPRLSSASRVDCDEARALTAIDLPMLAELSNLSVNRCDSLAVISAPRVPETITVEILNAPALETVDLSGLVSTDQLIIENTDTLSELSLPALTRVERFLTLTRNEGLTAARFPVLEEASFVDVHLSPVLEQLDLSALRTASTVDLEAVPNLTQLSISGLEDGDLQIDDAGIVELDLPDFTAPRLWVQRNARLERIRTPNLVRADVTVELNPMLLEVDLARFAEDELPGRRAPSLSLFSNDGLTAIALPAAVHVNRISVRANPVLETVSAPRLARVDESFVFEGNPSLARCMIESLEAQVQSAGGQNGSVTIEGNNPGCTCEMVDDVLTVDCP